MNQPPLSTLFPCKPDESTRLVSLAALQVPMTMLACDAGGAKFMVAFSDLKDITKVGSTLALWKKATLQNINAKTSTEGPFLPQGADDGVRVEAQGTRPDGSLLVVKTVWFSSRTSVFQAAVYADQISPAVVETFFSGLQLR